ARGGPHPAAHARPAVDAGRRHPRALTVGGAAHHVSIAVPLWLDLAAVFVGALFGALVAVRRDLDAFGTLGLAVCGGLGGGVVRDLLLNVMPVALTKPPFLPVAVGTGVLALVVHPYADRLDDLLDLADAFALGLFAVVGASKALDADLAAVPSAAVGVVAATAGGVLTDLLSGRRPYIFGPGPVYGIAAVAGSAVFVVVQALADSIEIGLVAAMVVTVGLRLLAVHRGLSTSPAARRRRRRAGTDRAR
ncbi:trimeric intracellular cation channel family protein, partial [Patulibacter sp. S7RM1-6]